MSPEEARRRIGLDEVAALEEEVPQMGPSDGPQQLSMREQLQQYFGLTGQAPDPQATAEQADSARRSAVLAEAFHPEELKGKSGLGNMYRSQLAEALQSKKTQEAELSRRQAIADKLLGEQYKQKAGLGVYKPSAPDELGKAKLEIQKARLELDKKKLKLQEDIAEAKKKGKPLGPYEQKLFELKEQDLELRREEASLRAKPSYGEAYGAVGVVKDEGGNVINRVPLQTRRDLPGYLGPDGKPWEGDVESREQGKYVRQDKQLEETVRNRKLREDKEQQRQKEKLDSYKQTHAKDYDKRVKELEKGIVSANIILAAIEKNPRLAMSVIRTQMPRLAGEVGNLSTTEQEAWTGDPSLFETVKRFGNTQFLADHVLTDRDVEEIRAVLEVMVNSRDKAYNHFRDKFVTRAVEDTGYDRDSIENYFGEALKPNVVGKGRREDAELDTMTDEELDAEEQRLLQEIGGE
jgi:hypothetical protein